MRLALSLTSRPFLADVVGVLIVLLVFYRMVRQLSTPLMKILFGMPFIAFAYLPFLEMPYCITSLVFRYGFPLRLSVSCLSEPRSVRRGRAVGGTGQSTGPVLLERLPRLLVRFLSPIFPQKTP